MYCHLLILRSPTKSSRRSRPDRVLIIAIMNLLLTGVPVEARVEIGYHPAPAWSDVRDRSHDASTSERKCEVVVDTGRGDCGV